MTLIEVKKNMNLLLKWLENKSSPVGCCVLSPKGEIFFFHNDGRMHCEQLLCNNFLCLKNHILFITLEPCFSCAFLLWRSGIKTIFFGAYNKEYSITRVPQYFIRSKMKYWGGIMQEQCEQFIQNFFKNKRSQINLENILVK